MATTNVISLASTNKTVARTKKATAPDVATLRSWYELLHLGRILDIKAANYLKQAKGWSYHAPCAGHEGIQLALGLAFRQKHDFLFPYYRDLVTVLAAGITPEEIILNGLSRTTDVAGGGRHMSNHFAKPSINIQNVSSLTGNHSLHAVGVARAIRYYKSDAISFYSGGESACSEGFFYEAINGASRERLPVVFVIQNNRYGISVPLHEQTANPIVSDNFSGFKHMHIVTCDGTDLIDSDRAIEEAIEYVRTGEGPAMVHADCERIGPHSNSDRHDLYRSGEELEAARARDPLPRFKKYLLTKGLLKEHELLAIEEKNTSLLDDAADRAEAAPVPDGSSLMKYLDPPLVLTRAGETNDLSSPLSPFSEAPLISYIDALNTTLKEEFRANPNTFLWGQDVASGNKGGVFNVTKGMQQEFGYGRVFNAPIAEDFIVGTANGFSRYREDIWVNVEGAEFADYFWPAMEQMVETSHEYWRTNGQFLPNIVIRIPSGGYIGGGLYHSQNIEGSLTTLSGIRIVQPAFADDAMGLLRFAMRSRGITVYLEPKFLYNYKPASAPRIPENISIPFGKARLRREGTDVSIITYGTAVHWALQAAERLASEENINAEVLDLRSLAPLDMNAILASVKKTSRVVVAHEDKMTGGFGGEIAARIASQAFEFLDAPVKRICSEDVHVGFAPALEKAALINPEKIFEGVKEVVRY